MKIELVYGDIFSVSCDAIVNPTDFRLSGSGGLDKRIQQMAGEGLWKELAELRKKPMKTGEAVITDGYNLIGRKIVHVASPKFAGKESYQELAAGYTAALAKASSKHLKTLAIPSIGTGTGGLPLSWPHCSDKLSSTEVVVLETINRFLHQSSWADGVDTVKLVFSNEKAYKGYQAAYDWLFGQGIDSRSRIRGCLLGGALGDALGYPVEFLGLPEADIRDMILTDGKAIISDDTQMTLFTACGLLFGETRAKMKGTGAELYHYVNMAYQDWYKTQNGGQGIDQMPVSWIREIPELNVLRAPGNTCLSALSQGGGSVKEPINNSKGCGAVMRIAPIPLFLATRNNGGREAVAKNCAEASAYTHGHPLGWLSSVALGIILFDIMQNFSLSFAVEDSMRFLRKNYGEYPDTETQIKLLHRAVSIAGMTGLTSSFSFVQEFDVIKQLGEGWVGEEALAVGLCCAMSGTGIKQALRNSVGHKGDSDSTGSIAGQILGAYYGEEALPKDWLGKLELRNVIAEIADDLYEGCEISEYSAYRDPAWEQKYLMCKKQPDYRQVQYETAWVRGGKQEIFIPGGEQFGMKWPEYYIWLRDNKFLHAAKTAADAKHGFGFGITNTGYDEKTGLHTHSWGWVRFNVDGAVEGYYGHSGFRLVPDRAKRQYLILADCGKHAWIGTITRDTKAWGNPLKIEVSDAALLAAVELIAMDKRLQQDFL